MNEAEGRGVHAVTQTSPFPRSVRKQMAEVTVAVLGANLGAGHSVGPVDVLDYVRRFQGLCEARPTGAAVEFVDGREQRFARHHVDIESWLFVVTVFVLKRPLCGGFLRDPVLLWRKQRHGIGIFVVCLHVRHSFAGTLRAWQRDDLHDLRIRVASPTDFGSASPPSVATLTDLARCTPSMARTAECV